MRIQIIWSTMVVMLICVRVSGQENPDKRKMDLSSQELARPSALPHGEYEQSRPMSVSKVTGQNLDSLINALIQANHFPGLAACIVKGEKIIWEGYYGLANTATNDSVDANTVFRLASVSKTVTASALMRLWERGRFQLDDSINAFLPFPVRNPYFPATAITFRNLLTHSSSIRDNFEYYPFYWGTDPQIALGTYLREYLTPGEPYYSSTNYNSTSAPGASVSYCNIGVSLCGYLVEVISGVPFDQYCRDSIFVPLGMTNTAWFLRDLDMSLIAHPYAWSGSIYSDYGLYSEASYPAGQLHATTRSLARWLIANINLGRLGDVRVLDSTTVRLMRTVAYWPQDWGGAGVGLVWMKGALSDGRWVWFHDGSSLGVLTTINLDELQKTGVIILTNANPVNVDAIVSIQNTLFTIGDTLTVSVPPTKDGPGLPSHHALSQNYPNPFNPTTTIRYAVPARSHVTLAVFNALGQKVAELVNAEKQAGSYDVTFNASGLASGVYFYRIQTGSFVQTKKLLLLK